MAKYIIVSINPDDVPKKVPPDAKLKVHWVTENIYNGNFFFKEGSLNEGSKTVRSGIFTCSLYKNEKDFLKEVERRKKVYSKNDFKKLYFAKSNAFIASLQAEMAIRKVLTNHFNFKGLFDGSPFAELIKLK
jgi:hypothetical protein